MLWRVRVALRAKPCGEQLPLDLDSTLEAPALSPLNQAELIAWDFQTQGLTTGPHPIALHRPDLDRLGVVPLRALKHKRSGTRVLIAGAVISRQRPPTAKGMCFLILEDETGRLPTALTPPLYEKFAQVLRAPALLMEGRLEDGGPMAVNDYRSVLISRLWPLESVCGGGLEMVGGVSGHRGQNLR